MSLILGSHLVANTILPIVAGLLVARFGTLRSSLVATGVLFLGQAVNLLGVFMGNVRIMIFGLCLFGYVPETAGETPFFRGRDLCIQDVC